MYVKTVEKMKKKYTHIKGGGHSPLEPLLGQIQIAKAATYTEICAKMSTLRNAWFKNS